LLTGCSNINKCTDAINQNGLNYSVAEVELNTLNEYKQNDEMLLLDVYNNQLILSFNSMDNVDRLSTGIIPRTTEIGRFDINKKEYKTIAKFKDTVLVNSACIYKNKIIYSATKEPNMGASEFSICSVEKNSSFIIDTVTCRDFGSAPFIRRLDDKAVYCYQNSKSGDNSWGIKYINGKSSADLVKFQFQKGTNILGESFTTGGDRFLIETNLNGEFVNYLGTKQGSLNVIYSYKIDDINKKIGTAILTCPNPTVVFTDVYDKSEVDYNDIDKLAEVFVTNDELYRIVGGNNGFMCIDRDFNIKYVDINTALIYDFAKDPILSKYNGNPVMFYWIADNEFAVHFNSLEKGKNEKGIICIIKIKA